MLWKKLVKSIFSSKTFLRLNAYLLKFALYRIILKAYKEYTFTGEKIFDSKNPAYIINNISNAVERPTFSDPLYTALHGPRANDSVIQWSEEQNSSCEQQRQNKNQKQLSHLINTTPLYLYHGKRYCVERENEDDDTSTELFDETRNALRYKYDYQKYPTEDSDIKYLTNFMGTEETMKYPVVKLRYKA